MTQCERSARSILQRSKCLLTIWGPWMANHKKPKLTNLAKIGHHGKEMKALKEFKEDKYQKGQKQGQLTRSEKEHQDGFSRVLHEDE